MARAPTVSVRDINAPSRRFLPLPAPPGLVDGWLRPGIQTHALRPEPPEVSPTVTQNEKRNPPVTV
jgi:hypothetical protein